MQAQRGDRIVVRGRSVGSPQRTGVVVDVLGPAGAPPYRVSWGDDAAPVLYYPGPDARIEPGPAVGSP